MDDSDIDPLMFEDDYYEERPTAAVLAMATDRNTASVANESSISPQPPQNDIGDTLDFQMAAGGGANSQSTGGGDYSQSTGGGANSPSTPIQAKRSVPSGMHDPTPKRRRLREKSSPPTAFISCSDTPESSSTSKSVQAATDAPFSVSSPDDSNDGNQPREKWQVPVDEWRDQYLMAYNVMRKFFYNSPEFHNLKLLPKYDSKKGMERRNAIYKQFSQMPDTRKVKLAEFASTSNQLSELEKKAVNARYLLQIKKPLRKGQLDTDNCFFHACFGLFTYHSDKWIFDRPSWMSKSVTEVTELCKSDIEMRRAWAFVAKDLKRFNLCHFNPKYGSGFELCTESFKQQNVLKLHLHICWKWLERQHIRDPAAFKIDGVVPVHVKQPPRDCLGPKARNVNPMLYYLEMPKIGAVFWDGNEKAFTAYPVNPRWITGWLQGKKITIKDAAQVIFFYSRHGGGARSPTPRCRNHDPKSRLTCSNVFETIYGELAAPLRAIFGPRLTRKSPPPTQMRSRRKP